MRAGTRWPLGWEEMFRQRPPQGRLAPAAARRGRPGRGPAGTPLLAAPLPGRWRVPRASQYFLPAPLRRPLLRGGMVC